ncbi:MAG TPA: DUF6541 family protein, partial [Aggregatilineales bacterium]|nr:DUF6541 family protein [Aggregatilineales bacterium]
MRSVYKHIDAGFIITLLLCAFTLIPLLKSGLPQGYDVLYHVYRVAEMDRSWQAGVYMPRWASSFYFGYGYPVFHYYASSTYYLTSILIALTGISAMNALRIVIALSLTGSGGGMYLFTRERYGKTGAILAALVYVYSPYIIYTEPYSRGDYPELLAFSLIPWILWCFERLTIPTESSLQRVSNVILASSSLALLIITHNLMAIVFFGMLAGWLCWLRLTRLI